MNNNSEVTTQLTFSPEQAANLSAVLHNAVRLINGEYKSHKDCVFLGYVTGGLLETARTLSEQVEAYLNTSLDNSQQEKQLPPLITAVTTELKAAGALIWMVQKSEDKTLLRCTLTGKQIRLILPSPSSKLPVNIDEEKNSAFHVVRDLTGLRIWLQLISS